MWPLVSWCVSEYVNLLVHALVFTLNENFHSGPFWLLECLLCWAMLYMLTHV